MNLNPINCFAPEIVLNILTFLNPEDLANYALTEKCCLEFLILYKIDFKNIFQYAKTFKKQKQRIDFLQNLLVLQIEDNKAVLQKQHEYLKQITGLQMARLKDIEKLKDLRQKNFTLAEQNLNFSQLLNKINHLVLLANSVETGFIFHTAKMCLTTHQYVPEKEFNEFWNSKEFFIQEKEMKEFQKFVENFNNSKKISLFYENEEK